MKSGFIQVKKVYSHVYPLSLWRWVSGGGIGVPCTVNPLHDGPRAMTEASKAIEPLLSETVTIRPLGLAVNEQLP